MKRRISMLSYATALVVATALNRPLAAAEKTDARTNAYWEVTAQIPAPKASAEFAWVDEALARCAQNYTVLLEQANKGSTAAKPWPKSVKDGQLVFIPGWDWCAGFFPGSLWYLYEATGDVKWRRAAEQYTEAQVPFRYSNMHHDLGFMYLPSAGNGLRLTGEKRYLGCLFDAARTLQTRWRPGAQAIQVWGIWDGTWGEACSVIVDCMVNLELFEFFATHPATGKLTSERDWLEGGSFRDMADLHAATTAKYLLREDGSSHHIAMLDYKTGKLVRYQPGQGIGHWSRGQSWLVYGFPMMFAYTKDPKYIALGEKVADWVLAAPNYPSDGVPYWDFMAPNIPNEERDSSAAAVLGCGFWHLSRLVKDASKAARYRAQAIKIAKSLSSPAYFAKPNELKGFLLKHAVGAKPYKSEIDVPLNYGDYYYLELLLNLKREKTW